MSKEPAGLTGNGLFACRRAVVRLLAEDQLFIADAGQGGTGGSFEPSTASRAV
jgi:hypothetical protein